MPNRLRGVSRWGKVNFGVRLALGLLMEEVERKYMPPFESMAEGSELVRVHLGRVMSPITQPAMVIISKYE
jgi:hypothetical protein